MLAPGVAEFRRRARQQRRAGGVRRTRSRPAWRLDPARLEAAVTPQNARDLVQFAGQSHRLCRQREELVAVLDIARRHGLWIIADEIYGRLVYGRERAPVVPRRDGGGRQNPVRADAVEELGDDRLAHRLARSAAGAGAGDRRSRAIFDLGRARAGAARGDRGARGGRAVPRRKRGAATAMPRPHGARGLIGDGPRRIRAARGRVLSVPANSRAIRDTRQLAFRLIDEAGVGAAPGYAFGPGGEGRLRLCFARAPALMAEATRRLAAWIAR